MRTVSWLVARLGLVASSTWPSLPVSKKPKTLMVYCLQLYGTENVKTRVWQQMATPRAILM